MRSAICTPTYRLSLDAQMQMFQYGTELAARKRAVPGGDVLSVGQPRRDAVSRARPSRRQSGAQPAPGLRRRRHAFLPGANLARVEATAIIPEVLSRMKNLELAGPVERCAIQSDERHPVDAGQIHGPSRQRKLLTYFPPGARSKPSNWKNAMVSPLRCGHPSLAACRCRRQRPRDVRCPRRSTGQMGRGSARTHPRRSRA